MSNIYSLDTLRDDIEKKYAPLKLELGDGTEVVLQNLLRLPAGTRKEVMELLRGMRKKETVVDEEGNEIEKEESADPDHMLAVTQAIIEKVAKDRKGKKLVAQIGDDLALTSKIIELWTAATQPGEAENSPV